MSTHEEDSNEDQDRENKLDPERFRKRRPFEIANDLGHSFEDDDAYRVQQRIREGAMAMYDVAEYAVGEAESNVDLKSLNEETQRDVGVFGIRKEDHDLDMAFFESGVVDHILAVRKLAPQLEAMFKDMAEVFRQLNTGRTPTDE